MRPARAIGCCAWTCPIDFPAVTEISAKLLARGRPLREGDVEDYTVATLEFATGAVARLACSWRLPAGCDAMISAAFYGAEGGAAFRNVDGGFHQFVAERFSGTARETLASPPDDWGGRAAADWVRRLAAGEGYDPAAARLVDVARILDGIYGR